METLIAWTKQGKPRACRAAALTALAQLAQAGNPGDAQRETIVKVVEAGLDQRSPLIRRSAVAALRDLGQSASPALAALDSLSRHDPSDQVRELAQKALEQIRNRTPAPVEVGRLREEIARLQKAQEGLLDSLKKLEAREGKPTVQAAK